MASYYEIEGTENKNPTIYFQGLRDLQEVEKAIECIAQKIPTVLLVKVYKYPVTPLFFLRRRRLIGNCKPSESFKFTFEDMLAVAEKRPMGEGESLIRRENG